MTNWYNIWLPCCKVHVDKYNICFVFYINNLTFYIETADVVIDQLEEKSKAVSLTQLAAFVVALPAIRRDMIRMQDITNDLRINASQLNDGEFL